MGRYTERMIALVEAGGGQVSEQMFVDKPGVLVLSTAEGVRREALQLFDQLNIYTGQSNEDRLAEFTARITYLSFPNNPDQAKSESQRLHALLKASGHTSPYEVAGLQPNVLVAGISIETMLEIIANKYAIGRVCSSRTDAMTVPLFRVPDAGPEVQRVIRAYIKSVAPLHSALIASVMQSDTQGLSGKDLKEIINMGHPGYKAGFMVVAATPDFWEKKIARRLSDNPDGVELELRGILKQLADALHQVCPEIHPSSQYA